MRFLCDVVKWNPRPFLQRTWMAFQIFYKLWFLHEGCETPDYYSSLLLPIFLSNLVSFEKKRKSTLLKIIKKKINMVDIVPNSQEIVGHGSFSIVYKARLEAVSKYSLIFLRRLLTFIVAHCARKPLKTIFDANWHNEMLLKHFHRVF